MRINEILNEAYRPQAQETPIEREIAQKQYMQGECMVLAIAIHRHNPKKYPLGFVYEYNEGHNNPDMTMDPIDWETLDDDEKQEIALDKRRWSLNHAYVFDTETQEYIDARGRHKSLPFIGQTLNATTHNKFPATIQELIATTNYMEFNDDTGEWMIEQGMPAFQRVGSTAQQQQAWQYAVKFLGVQSS